MKRKGVYALVSGLVAVAAVALLLTLVILPGSAGIIRPGVSAPNVASTPMVASPAVAPAVQEKAPPGSPQEGITVHGHWTIEVRNPDGSLAEHREFENALYPDGNQTLVNVLARQNSVGGWSISLRGNPTAFSGYIAALLVETSYPDANMSPNLFKTLTVNVPTSGANAGKLVLSGTATATADGIINIVGTGVCRLSSSSPPSNYYNIAQIIGFTTTGLASPVSLTTGQQVQATVVISFS